MKKALIFVCFGGLLVGAALAGDSRPRRHDPSWSNTPAQGVALKAGSNDCTSPVDITALPFNDTGDTTDAGSTIDQVSNNCPGLYQEPGTSVSNLPGPDQIYMITVGSGNSLNLTLTTSDDNYDPAIYLVTTCGDGSTCTIGSDVCYAVANQFNPCDPISTESIDVSGMTSGTYYFFVDSYYSQGEAGVYGGTGNGPYTVDVTGTLPVQLIDFEIN